MRAVADRGEVALGTLYRYFPSKIHLLVSAFARELERASKGFERRAIPGETAHQRVIHVLGRTSRALQRDPHVTGALTRAFLFADASVVTEVNAVGTLVTRLIVRAMADPEIPSATPNETVAPAADDLTADDLAIAKMIGDLWLASLVQWVTGRASPQEVARSMDVAVRLLLR